MEKKTYTFWQKLVAAFAQESVEWHYATYVEKLIMRYKALSEEDKKIFLNEINK